MHFIQGDYISSVWIYEARDAIWTVLLVKRVLTESWEVSVTWDAFDPATDQAKCSAPFHTVRLPGDVPEEEIIEHIDANIRIFELSGVSNRIAMLEIHSDDPRMLIQKFEELAMKDERIACSFVVREIPELDE